MNEIAEVSLGDMSDLGTPGANKQFFERLATQALVAVGAFCKDTAPLTQFVRHIRNGCAHGNRFDIRMKDPIPAVTWRNHTITRSMNGQKVVGWDDGSIRVTEAGGLLHEVADYLRSLP